MPTIISGDGTITGLTSTGISAVQALPVGTIKQVVTSTATSGSSSTTSATFVDSGFSLSITPTSASSKIFAIFNFNLQGNSGAQAQTSVTIFRSSTNIMNSSGNLLYSNTSGSNIHSPVTLSIVDSPSTTSATTYSLRHKADTSTTSIIQTAVGAVTITLMEIAA